MSDLKLPEAWRTFFMKVIETVFLSYAVVKTLAWLVPLHTEDMASVSQWASRFETTQMVCPHKQVRKAKLSNIVSISVILLFPDSKTPLSLINGSCVVARLKLEGCPGGHQRGTSANSTGQTMVALIKALCCSKSSLPCMTYPSPVSRLAGEGHSCLQELKTVLISELFLWCKLSEITRQSWRYWGIHYKLLLGKPALLFHPALQVWKLKIRTSSIFGVIQQTSDLLVWESEVSSYGDCSLRPLFVKNPSFLELSIQLLGWEELNFSGCGWWTKASRCCWVLIFLKSHRENSLGQGSVSWTKFLCCCSVLNSLGYSRQHG